MTRPVVVHADPETLVVAALTTALTARGETVTVDVGVPDTVWDPDIADGWPSTVPPHVQVNLDGANPASIVARRCLIRLTVWATTTTEAQRLADLAGGLLAAGPHTGISSARVDTGPTPAIDPDTRAELATVMATAVIRSRLA